jgi:von Willebrand factor A domain-containing protein 8
MKSGDSPTIPLTEADKPPAELRDRWKVVEKMAMVTQYAFSGDYTGWLPYHPIFAPADRSLIVEAIEKSVLEVAKYDAGKFSTFISTCHTHCIYQMTGL